MGHDGKRFERRVLTRQDHVLHGTGRDLARRDPLFLRFGEAGHHLIGCRVEREGEMFLAREQVHDDRHRVTGDLLEKDDWKLAVGFESLLDG